MKTSLWILDASAKRSVLWTEINYYYCYFLIFFFNNSFVLLFLNFRRWTQTMSAVNGNGVVQSQVNQTTANKTSDNFVRFPDVVDGKIDTVIFLDAARAVVRIVGKFTPRGLSHIHPSHNLTPPPPPSITRVFSRLILGRR